MEELGRKIMGRKIFPPNVPARNLPAIERLIQDAPTPVSTLCPPQIFGSSSDIPLQPRRVEAVEALAVGAQMEFLLQRPLRAALGEEGLDLPFVLVG
jgi:hypothetical protein